MNIRDLVNKLDTIAEADSAGRIDYKANQAQDSKEAAVAQVKQMASTPLNNIPRFGVAINPKTGQIFYGDAGNEGGVISPKGYPYKWMIPGGPAESVRDGDRIRNAGLEIVDQGGYAYVDAGKLATIDQPTTPTDDQSTKPQYLNIDKATAAKFISLVDKVEKAKAAAATTTPAANTTPASNTTTPTTGQDTKPGKNLLPVDPKVQAMQKAIQDAAKAAGQPDPLPVHGADGRMGPETQKAMAKYPQAAKQTSAPTVAPPTMAAANTDVLGNVVSEDILGLADALMESFGFTQFNEDFNWDQNIVTAGGVEIPYSWKDAAIDAGLLGAGVVAGTLAAPFTGGASEAAALAANAGRIARVGNAIKKWYEVSKATIKSKDALVAGAKQVAKNASAGVKAAPGKMQARGTELAAKAVHPTTLAKTAVGTAAFNTAVNAAPEPVKQAGNQALDWAANKVLPGREEDKQFNLNESMASLRDRLKQLDEETPLGGALDKIGGRALKQFAEKLGKEGVERLAKNWGVDAATIDRIARKLAGKAGADLEQSDIKIMKDRWAKLSDAEKEALRKGTVTPASNKSVATVSTTTQTAQGVKPAIPTGEIPPGGKNAVATVNNPALAQIKTIEQVPPQYRSKIADILSKNKGMTIASAIIAAGLVDQVLNKSNTTTLPTVATTTPTTTGQDTKPNTPTGPTTPAEDPNAADMATLKAMYDQFMAAKGEGGGLDFEPQLADAIKRYEALVAGQGGKPKQAEFRSGSYASKGEDHMKGTDGSNLLFPVLKESDELSRWLKIARG